MKDGTVWLFGLGVAAMLLLKSNSPAATTSSVSVDRMGLDSARVKMPEGRVYLVSALGGGAYNVARTDVPNATLTFNQTGIQLRIGDTRELEADIRRFPKDLFT